MFLLLHPVINQPPPPIPSPIICNNNTMDIEFLVQMGQSDKCGTARNDIYATYTWDLVQAFESAYSASCKIPATFIDSIRPNN